MQANTKQVREVIRGVWPIQTSPNPNPNLVLPSDEYAFRLIRANGIRYLVRLTDNLKNWGTTISYSLPEYRR